MATTGRLTPQLKREFTDNFPLLHLDWLDGADIVDEVFSNPLPFRAWVTKDTIARETVYAKIPFTVRRAIDDTTATVRDAILSDWLTVEGGQSIEVGSLEHYRPPESLGWAEAFGPGVGCTAVLSTSPPDLHALERLHAEVLEKLFGACTEVLIIRFGIPHLVPTKKPGFEKGIRVPNFSPRSHVVRPGQPAIPEHDFVLLKSTMWRFPADLSVAEGDWGNWQSNDNQALVSRRSWRPIFSQFEAVADLPDDRRIRTSRAPERACRLRDRNTRSLRTPSSGLCSRSGHALSKWARRGVAQLVVQKRRGTRRASRRGHCSNRETPLDRVSRP
jgi:hypothetical protein